MNNIIISGGISGAISDPESPEAQLHAYKYYEEIRHRKDDVFKIAKHTGYTLEQILKVKNFLFLETHILDKEIRRFDPSFEIAQSWQRLADMPEYTQSHDLVLIPHEIMEMNLINEGLSQEDAHIKASKKYNYTQEANKFYDNLKSQNKARLKKTKNIETKNSIDDWEMSL